MKREEAISVLQKIKPIPHRADNKCITHAQQTIALNMAIQALEQEPIIDKIRAEIEQGYCDVSNDYDYGRNYGLYMATQIIDKYKQESGGERMTNEQAKDIIEKYLALDSDADSEYIQAQKVAVETLKQESSRRRGDNANGQKRIS